MVIFISSSSFNLNLDLVPLLFFFFFLYSALEILITVVMADYRFIPIEQGFETEEDEIDLEENLIPDRIIDFNPIHGLEEEEDDDDDDYDDDEDDDDEEEEYLVPEIILPVNLDIINELEDDNESDSDYDDDDDDEEEDYDDDEDYEDDDDDDEVEVEELDPASPERDVSSSVSGDRRSVVMENSTSNSNDFVQRKEEVNRCEIDGLICPICFEAWTSGGQHQISCLPCGHIYGFSCIKKWLLQNQGSGKCPQCNHFCTLKDVRVLYASRLCVADEELHKRVQSLEAKCAYLEQKAAPLTHDELINQICSNPTLVERLAIALADLH